MKDKIKNQVLLELECFKEYMLECMKHKIVKNVITDIEFVDNYEKYINELIYDYASENDGKILT